MDDIEKERLERKREYNRQRYYRKKEMLNAQTMARRYKNLPQEKIDKKIKILELLGYRVEKIEQIPG